MRSCDVLVVGGGPAGSSCARRLVRAGMDVIVVDRAVFPRPKVCAGWVTPPVLEELDVDLADYGRGRVLQPITSFRTGLIGGATRETRYDRPVSYGIRRYELDHYLLARTGARIVTGVSVSRLERRAGRWVCNGELEAPMLVGAGGHFCPVARWLGGGRPGEPIVAAQEVELRLTPSEERACRVAPEMPELYFARDLAGYGWCFRKGDHLNVGFGRQGRDAFATHAGRFVEFLRAAGRVPASALEKWQGHAYLLYRDHTRRRVGDGVLLVGDAAGLAYAQSGEGIRTAVESGLLAADTIVRAGGRYGAAELAEYDARIVALFGRSGPPRAASLLPTAWTEALGHRVLQNPWTVRHLVLDRWFLHRGSDVIKGGYAPAADRPPRRAALGMR